MLNHPRRVGWMNQRSGVGRQKDGPYQVTNLVSEEKLDNPFQSRPKRLDDLGPA